MKSPYCAPKHPLIVKYIDNCRYVTQGETQWYFSVGFNHMVSFYAKLRANGDNLDMIETFTFWKNEMISAFNIFQAQELRGGINKRVEDYLGQIDDLRLVFYLMLGVIIPVIGLCYAMVYFPAKNKEWLYLMQTLSVCPSSMLMKNAGVKGYFSRRVNLWN